MELRNGESLIQYKQGLFSRIKNTIVSLFSNEEKDENKTANVGHDRLHEVLKQDRIRNNDIRVTKEVEKISIEEVVQKDQIKAEDRQNIAKEKNIQIVDIEKENKDEETIITERENKQYFETNKTSKSDIEELLTILKILNDNKVDTKKIKTFKSVNKHRKATILRDINQNDIDINTIIQSNNLVADYPIGRKIELARRRINNIDKYRREITKEQIKQLESLGIIK